MLVVGRLVERKGIGNVIEALADVPDVELVVAGGSDRGPPRRGPRSRAPDGARRAAAASPTASSCVGRVDRDELPALMRSADLVVCAPWYEPFGIVPLEAMACGRPVLATAVGGLVDTVVDGVTGRHVPPRRPDLLAAAMRELLADPDARDGDGPGRPVPRRGALRLAPGRGRHRSRATTRVARAGRGSRGDGPSGQGRQR